MNWHTRTTGGVISIRYDGTCRLWRACTAIRHENIHPFAMRLWSNRLLAAAASQTWTTWTGRRLLGWHISKQRSRSMLQRDWVPRSCRLYYTTTDASSPDRSDPIRIDRSRRWRWLQDVTMTYLAAGRDRKLLDSSQIEWQSKTTIQMDGSDTRESWTKRTCIMSSSRPDSDSEPCGWSVTVSLWPGRPAGVVLAAWPSIEKPAALCWCRVKRRPELMLIQISCESFPVINSFAQRHVNVPTHRF
jgi:hypothetical protein